MKIKFNSDDDLPLNQPLNFYAMTIIIRFVFEEDSKLYLQLFLDDILYELKKCCCMKKLMFQKELMLIKQVRKKNVRFAIIGTLTMLDLSFDPTFVINITMC